MGLASTYSSTLLSGQSVIRRQSISQKGQVQVNSNVGRFWLVSLLFVALVAQVYVRLLFVSKGYELEAVRSSVLERDSELRQLELDKAYIGRPESVMQLAQEKLNFVQLSPQRIRSL